LEKTDGEEAKNLRQGGENTSPKEGAEHKRHHQTAPERGRSPNNPPTSPVDEQVRQIHQKRGKEEVTLELKGGKGMSEDLMNEILKIMIAEKEQHLVRVFTAEDLAQRLKGRYSLKEIRDAMWSLNQQGKAKLWVCLP